MHANTDDVYRLSLMALRLMDADLLLPEEERALLTEIEAFAQAQDKAEITSGERFLPMREALAQIRSREALTEAQALEIARRILANA